LETITPVSTAEALEEAWFLGLRLTGGVSLHAMGRRFGEAATPMFQSILLECEQQGLLEREDDTVRLTPRGRLFSNDVFARFLGVLPEQETAANPLQEQGVGA
jgi:oxygen-independent coproporphyrinogen-3 oxidase